MTESIEGLLESLGNLPDVIGTVERWVRGDEPLWPYARCLSEWGLEFEMYRKQWERGSFGVEEHGASYDFASRVALHGLRDQYIRDFGYMLPCAELLDELQKAEHVVEIGAGTGYMTAIMRHRGINVTGSDPAMGHGHIFDHGKYDATQVRAEGKTMVRRFPRSLVFCAWPSLAETWFRQMLKAMHIGQRIVTVLEDCTAEESGRQYFECCFETERTIDIPTFVHLNDLAYVATKKRQKFADGS